MTILSETTFEQRLGLYWPSEANAGTQAELRAKAVPELIRLMGPLHVHHPQYKPKPGLRASALEHPNLALLGRPALYRYPRISWLRRLAIYYTDVDS